MADVPKVKECIAGIQNSLQCSICLELFRKPVVTKCGHKFCEVCITQCFKRKASVPCPTCAEPIAKRGLKQGERLDTLTTAVRELVRVYEEDSRDAFTIPSGPSRPKLVETRPPVVATKPEKSLTSERVAMASLENTDTDVIDVTDTVSESKKLTRRVNAKKRSKKSKESLVGNDDTSVFSAERSASDVGETSVGNKEPAPDIFVDEDLCPTVRKKRSRKAMIMKVKNWLSRLPPVLGTDEESSPPNDDSQSSDHTVLLESDADLEAMMDISSQNATIAPESSRSLSLSSGTSPNTRRFFKYREQKSELTRVNVISPTAKSDDPYAFPTSATKLKPPKRPTRKPNPKTNSASATTTGAKPQDAFRAFAIVKKNLDSKNENPDSKLDLGVTKDDDFKEDAKSTESDDIFYLNSVENSKSKGVHTYANARRYKLRSRKTKRVKYVSDDETENEFQSPTLLAERSDCSTLVDEPIAKKRKGDSLGEPHAERIQNELESVEAFQLDVMTASQNVRETDAKREQISSKAKREVKKILGRDLKTSAVVGISVASEKEPSAGPSSAVRNNAGMDWDESDPIQDGDSDSGTEELILEVHVKDPDHPSQPTEAIERYSLSPTAAEAVPSLSRIGLKTCEERNEIKSQCPEVLVPVSIVFSDSEMPDSEKKVDSCTESGKASIRNGDSQNDVSPGPVRIGSERTAKISYNSSKKLSVDPVATARRESPIMMGSPGQIRRESGKRSETEANGEESSEDVKKLNDRESAVLKCRESDSSGDELPDLSSQLKTHPSFRNNVFSAVERVDDVIKFPSDDARDDGTGCDARDDARDYAGDDARDDATGCDARDDARDYAGDDARDYAADDARDDARDDTTDESGDVTESISLSVSQVRYERPTDGPLAAGTSESASTISSIYAPREPLNSEHNLSMTSPSGKQSVSKSTPSSKSLKTNTCSEYSKLSSETQATNLTTLSEPPTTQMQENLRKELDDLSRLIREKEAQLLQLKTQGESTLASDSESESELFKSQDATCYERLEIETRRSPIFSPTSSLAPPTPPSVQKSNHSGQDGDSIIAPTPRKSAKSLAAELARTFSSIKAARGAEDDKEIPLVERPTQKRDWKRIRTGSDSDSDSEMVVPNSFDDVTPKRSLDVFLTKKRLLEVPSTSLVDPNDDKMEESSSASLKTPTHCSLAKNPRSSKGSELVKCLTKRELLRREPGDVAGTLRSPMVARGGLPVIPSLSRTRGVDSSGSTVGNKRRKLNETNKASSGEDFLSESCDFMAAMRSQSPETTTTTVVPDSGGTTTNDVTETGVLQDCTTSDKDPNAGQCSQSSTKDSETKIVKPTEKVKPFSAIKTPTPILVVPTPAPVPVTAARTPVSATAARTPVSAIMTPSVVIQSPLSGSLAVMSPYQGELLRARREQHRGLVVSGLDSQSREFISAFTRKFDFRFSQNFGDETSHVVVQTVAEGELVCDRTLKYFLGIAGRCWVLSKQWLIDSVEQDFLEPEDSYEIKGDTVNGEEHHGPWRARNARAQLLADFTICCHGQFSNLARAEIVRLIELCGGSALVDEQSFADAGPTKWRRLLLAEPHDDLRSSYFHALKRKYGMPVVSREWLLDSIAKYQVQKLKDYSLCTSA